MTDNQKIKLYNPFTKKETEINPYGQTAKKIYKYKIAGGATPDSVLPEDLNYSNGRFKKIKIQQDLNNVKRITYEQVKDIEEIESYFRNLFSQYKGQTIKRVIKYTYEGEVVEQSQIVDIPTAYGTWWKKEGLHFFMIDSETFIFGDDMNDGLEAKFQAQLLILTQNKVDGENYNQYFLDGVNHCFLHPIKNWAADCLIEAKSKTAKGRYKKIIKDVSKLEIEYVNGVPENAIGSICNDLQIGIEIDLPTTSLDKKTKYIEYQSHKKPLKVFKFINTRLNHIELNDCKSKDEYEELTQEKMTELYNKLRDDGDFMMWKQSRNGVHQINTLDKVYKLSDVGGFMEAVKDFENLNNLSHYKVNHYDNPELSQFLIGNCHTNQSIIFNEDYDELENLKHIDMKKSYSRAMDCPQYEGYLAKITDFRQCDEIVGLGIYQVENINFNGNDLIENLKVFYSGAGYPSPELKFYQSLGITFDIVAGCWGSSFDIEFTPAMFEKELGVSHYCKWYGITCSHSFKDRYSFTCENIEYAKLNAFNEKEADIRFNEYTGDGLIEYNKKAVYHQYHIASFITSYARINLFNQLKKFEDIKQIVAVQVDGIYYTGDVEMTDLFVSKDKMTIDYIETEEFIDSMSGAYMDEDELPVFRKHNMAEVHVGAGGCGKTHINLEDKGFQSILYVAPSWKLARKKKEEYGCRSSVFHYLLDDDPHKWRTILRSYSTLVIDEISMLAEADKEKIMKRFNKLKIIFCGDIGYQLPPVRGKEFIIGNLPTQEHTTNHRCKCEKLAKVLKHLRSLIKDDLQFIDNGKSSYYGLDVIPSDEIKYDTKDMIITATHKQKDFYTEKYKNQDKYTVLSNSMNYSNGEIIIGPKPEKVHCELRHAFTIHSIQGETATETLFIDMRKMRSVRMMYTALSRSKYLSQIVLIRSPKI